MTNTSSAPNFGWWRRFGEGDIDAWGFGPCIIWPAFNLGRVRSRLRAAGARADGALAVYDQTVLLALGGGWE